MQTKFLILASALLVSANSAIAAPVEDAVKADLVKQANLAYGVVLADGVVAGRLYSRPATASGTKRHVEEFIARQYVPLPRISSAR